MNKNTALTSGYLMVSAAYAYAHTPALPDGLGKVVVAAVTAVGSMTTAYVAGSAVAHVTKVSKRVQDAVDDAAFRDKLHNTRRAREWRKARNQSEDPPHHPNEIERSARRSIVATFLAAGVAACAGYKFVHTESTDFVIKHSAPAEPQRITAVIVAPQSSIVSLRN